MADQFKIFNLTKGTVTLARTGKKEYFIRSRAFIEILANEVEEDPRLKESIKRSVELSRIDVSIIGASLIYPKVSTYALDTDEISDYVDVERTTSGGGGDDELVKVSASDTISEYLSATLVAHPNTPIDFNILTPGANESLEIELDGDQVEIDWVPTNYTRDSSPAEAGDLNDLTSNLKGVDNFLGDLTTSTDLLAQRIRLEELYSSAYANHYTEFSYTGKDLTTVDIWETSGKVLKLFTRTLSYTGKNLTTVVTTDEQTSAVLTNTLVYAGKNLVNTTKVVT